MKLSIILVLFGISQVFGGLQGSRNFISMGPRGPESFWCGFQFAGKGREVVPATDHMIQQLDCIFIKGLPISFHTLYIRAVSLVFFKVRTPKISYLYKAEFTLETNF